MATSRSILHHSPSALRHDAWALGLEPRSKRAVAGWIAFGCLDVLSAVTAFWLLQNPDGPLFTYRASDVAALATLRNLCAALVLFTGRRVFLQLHREVEREHALEVCAKDTSWANGTAGLQLREMGSPLLPSSASDTELGAGAGPFLAPSPTSTFSPGTTPTATLCQTALLFSDHELERQHKLARAMKGGKICFDALLWFHFIVSASCAIYVGVKCVLFQDPLHSTAATGLLGAQVLLCHASFYAAKKALDEVTLPPGLLLPWLHMHPLQFEQVAESRYCTTCRLKIRGTNHGGAAFHCPVCVHNYYCIQCLKRQQQMQQSRGVATPQRTPTSPRSGRRGGGTLKAEVEKPTLKFMLALLPLILPYWHWVVLAFVSIMCNQAVAILMPGQMGKVLDSIVSNDPAAFKEFIVTFLLINLLTGLFTAAQSSAVLGVCRHLVFRTRSMVFAKILEQDMSYFDENLAGQIVSHLVNDADRMTDPVSLILNNVVTNIIRLIGGLVMCFSTSWRMSIMALTAIFPITYLVRSYAQWAATIWRKVGDTYGDAVGAATETVQNIRTVRCFGAEQLEKKRYEGFLTRVYHYDMLDTWTRTATLTLNSYLDLSIGVFVLWYGGMSAMSGSGSLSLGQLITFQLYWSMMKDAFNGLNDVGSALLRATASAHRVLGLLELKPQIPNVGEELVEGEVLGDLVLQEVHFDYAEKRSHRSVLNGISLDMCAGQVTALVGKSGSGKSTIASLLLRLYDVTRGRILLDGKDLRSIKPSSLRAQIGVVQQETQLFADSIGSNITYAMSRPYTQEEIDAAAEQSNALSFISSFSDGFNSLCGDRGVKLSGGQKQRIAIARMFLRRPPILILDEATSALDAENEAIVQQAIDRLVDSHVCRTVVVIAHRLSTVRHANKIAVLKDGVLVELGTHDELTEQPEGVYARLVERQLEAFKQASAS